VVAVEMEGADAMDSELLALPRVVSNSQKPNRLEVLKVLEAVDAVSAVPRMAVASVVMRMDAIDYLGR
jgi:hypothetical protein